MKLKRFVEAELLEGLSAHGAHADELVELIDIEVGFGQPANDSIEWHGEPVDWDWDE